MAQVGAGPRMLSDIGRAWEELQVDRLLHLGVHLTSILCLTGLAEVLDVWDLDILAFIKVLLGGMLLRDRLAVIICISIGGKYIVFERRI